MAAFATQKKSGQDPLAKYAHEIGWTFVSESDALTLRHGETGVFFSEVIARIESVRARIEGNAEMLAWLRGERSVFVPAEKRQHNVTVFDHPARNVFHVTVEWQYTPVGCKGNRADVMFLINGIPVALGETKSAKQPGRN